MYVCEQKWRLTLWLTVFAVQAQHTITRGGQWQDKIVNCSHRWNRGHSHNQFKAQGSFVFSFIFSLLTHCVRVKKAKSYVPLILICKLKKIQQWRISICSKCFFFSNSKLAIYSEWKQDEWINKIFFILISC